MATKLTPINQEIVLDLKAKAGDVENSIKGIIQKLQGMGLSDSFSKSYISSLQKVLDKSQELKKVISTTTETNPQGVAAWVGAYDKLGFELTRIISKLENNKLDFSDLVGYDKAEYNRLINELKDVKKTRDEIYTTKNIATKAAGKLTPGTSITPTFQAKIIDPKVISNQEEINRLMADQEAKLKNAPALAQSKLDIATKELEVYRRLKVISAELQTSDMRTTQGKKLRSELHGYGITGQTRAELEADVKTKLALTNEDKLGTKAAKAQIANASAIALLNTQLQELDSYKTQILAFAAELGIDFNKAAGLVKMAALALEIFEREAITAGQTDMDKTQQEMEDAAEAARKASMAAGGLRDGLTAIEQRDQFFSNLQSRVTQLFGLTNAFQLLRRFINESLDAIKELDAAFTKIAVVTEFTTEDLWESFDTYNTMAQRLGVTTTDAIETSALYYQQGLDTANVMTLTTETIKMAQIANMGFTEATQAMTAAIRGFKMEMQDAGLVTDIYSALAAEAAVDTQDLAVAISKVASIAGSAGLSFENTSAFLTQIIETTQEAAETAGTALKTIIARFTELTKNPSTLVVEVEEEQVSANKIEEALATAQVALRDVNGEFRDLDIVFLELSEKWDSLSRNTQRYIATVAAGSRQQSRFIAMMDDYKRTQELVAIANNSAGASQIQFAKTLDSVGTKINKLTANFQKLIGNLVENQFVKDFLDLLNKGLSYLVDVSDRGVLAFTTMIVTLGIVIKNALSLIIGGFSSVVKKWETLKANISKTIVTPVVFEPDLSKWEAAKAKVTGTPLATTATPVAAAKPGDPNFIGPLPKTANTALTQGIKTSVASGMAAGLLMGIATGDWKAALTMSLVSSVTSALGNPAIMSAIKGSKFGGALTSVGGALVKALPWAAIAAGVIFTGAQLYKWLDPLEQAKRKVTEIKKEISELQDELQQTQANFLAQKETLGSLTENISEYKKLSSQITLTADEQDRLNELSTELASKFPELIAGYDNVGNAILNQRADWEQIVKLQKESTQLAKEQYANNVLTTSYLDIEIVDAEFKDAQERVERFTAGQSMADSAMDLIGTPGYDSSTLLMANYLMQLFAGNINLLGEEKKELKDAQAIVENVDAHTASISLSSLKMANALKQVAEADLSSLESLFDTDLSNQTSVFGQSFVADRTKEIKDFLADVQNADSDAALKDLESYKNLSQEAKNFLTSIEKTGETTAKSLQNLKTEDLVKILTDASGQISENIFSSLSDLDKTYKEQLSNLLDDTSHLTVAAFREQLVSILGEDNPLLDTILKWFSETTAATNQYLAGSFGNDIVKSFLGKVKEKGGSLNDLIAAMANGEGTTYLIDLGFDPRDAGTFVQEIQNFLDSQDYTYVVDVVGTANYDQMVQTYGQAQAAAGVEYMQGTGADTKVIDALSGGDVTSVTGAQTLLAQLINDVGINYDTAKQYVLDYAKAVGQSGNVNDYTIDKFVSLNNVLNKTRSLDKYAQTLKNLNGNFLDLNNEGIQELIENVPGAADVLKDLRDGAIDGAKASEELKKVLFAKDLYDIQGAIADVNTAVEDYGIGSYEAAAAINELGLTQDEWAAFQPEIQAVLTGNSEALWGYIATTWDATNATATLNGITLNGMAQQISAATGTSSGQVQALTKDMEAYALVLQDLGIGEIKEAWVDVPVVNGPYVAYHKQKITYFEYKTTKGSGFGGYTPRAPKDGDGGKESEYETKVDQYYNEIQAIENLNNILDDLAEKREAGNLTPEEYEQNIQATVKYYKELQNKLHEYNEMLRKDQKKLAEDINKAGYEDALKVVNGQLMVNKSLIEGLSPTTRKTIDDQISAYEDLSETIAENSDEWMKAQQKQLDLLEESQQAYLDLEQKIIDILIEQEQKIIETTEKKYDALKKADNDYLEALRDNINKRRKVRDKEESYSDLAKKEKRLALLKRDTSGIYASEIIALEEEIAQQRQDLADQETDDMVTNLEEQAKTRSDAYDEELEELNNLQKDKEESMTYYNQKANEIMAQGYDQLMAWFMQNDTEYMTATATAQQQYIQSWQDTINTASSLSGLIRATGGMTAAQSAAHAEAEAARRALSSITSENPTASGGETYALGARQISSFGAEGALAWYNQHVKDRKDISEKVKGLFWQIVAAKFKYDRDKFTGYSAGGLADFTGLAMVHGSTTDPEAFLSAKDTRNFQTLAQLLSSAITYNGASGETPEGGGTTVMGDINITIEVAELGDDYDVEQMVEKVKQEIVNSSNYRNVNLINKVR